MTWDPFFHEDLTDRARPSGCARMVAITATAAAVGIALLEWGAGTTVGIAAVAAAPATLIWGLVWTRHQDLRGIDHRGGR